MFVCVRRDRKGQTPYVVAPERDTRNTFRKYMGDHPDKYDYSKAQVLTPVCLSVCLTLSVSPSSLVLLSAFSALGLLVYMCPHQLIRQTAVWTHGMNCLHVCMSVCLASCVAVPVCICYRLC